MSKKDFWIVCETCDAEFKVVAETSYMDKVSYCPFCSEPLPEEDFFDDEDSEDY